MSLKLHQPTAEIYVFDGVPEAEALARTTHLGIGAHHDDLEILAMEGVLNCFAQPDRWFTGVVVSDGAGSPRDLEYKDYTDAQMKIVRRREQKKAAFVGEYAAQLLLDHPSSAIKDGQNQQVVDDLVKVLEATQPQLVYTHNLADKHDTHVAVLLRVIAACRKLPAAQRPSKLVGCEVWRDLDWLSDEDKVRMAVDGHENLQNALLGVFDSQIAGGKRYDLATMGRRKAHATYSESHGTDSNSGVIFGMDLTPLLSGDTPPAERVGELIRSFEAEVRGRIDRLS